MKSRLSEIRKALNLTTVAFAKELGLNQPTYYRYENATNKMPPEFIIKLADEYNVNIHWLFTGEGEMFIDNERDDTLRNPDLDQYMLGNTEKPCERLMKVREAFGLEPFEMGYKINIPPQEYAKFEKGDKELTKTLLFYLYLYSKSIKKPVNIGWILTGKGDMFCPDTNKKQRA